MRRVRIPVVSLTLPFISMHEHQLLNQHEHPIHVRCKHAYIPRPVLCITKHLGKLKEKKENKTEKGKGLTTYMHKTNK